MRFSLLLIVALGLGRSMATATPEEEDLVAQAVEFTQLDSTLALHTAPGGGFIIGAVQRAKKLIGKVVDKASDKLFKKIIKSKSCSGCKGILALMKGLAALGEDKFTATLIKICKQSAISGDKHDSDVCEGTLKRQAPAIRRAVKKVTLHSRSGDLLCLTLLGLCKYPKVAKFNFKPKLTPKPNMSRPVPSGQAPLKVVHIADIHVDRKYVVGSNAQCTKPICCRPYKDGDRPGRTQTPAGRFGSPRCNTPVTLERSMYQAINRLVPNASFALFTGDVVDAVVWDTSQEHNLATIAASYEVMAAHLPHVYPVVGNHEMHPANLIPPQKSKFASAQWMYDAVADNTARWIGDDAAASLGRFGGYSILHRSSNLRILTLNTNVYYKFNYHMYRRKIHKDPDGQIAWLAAELAEAERRGENVWILGHQSFGDISCFRHTTKTIDRLVARYSGSIRAMFFGHTHMDEWQVTYSDYHKKDHGRRTVEEALVTSYVGPSLTPARGRNPAFRVYDVDPVTFAIVDSTTYYADMRHESFKTAPEWKKYYSAKEAYGPHVRTPPKKGDELTAGFWTEVTQAFERDDELFREYFARKTRGFEVQSCTGDCKAQELCRLRAARSESNCFKPKPGLNLGTRELKEEEEEQEEDVDKLLRGVMASLATNVDALELLAEGIAEGRVEQMTKGRV
ncbi:hypothetical protein ACHAQH_005121 [Verticillium albo-atrum]